MASLYHPPSPRPLLHLPSSPVQHRAQIQGSTRPRSFRPPLLPSPDNDMAQATLFDPLDFECSDPSTSPILWSTWPTSPSPSPTGFSLANSPRPSLEREICSNFACCGLAIADLHELIKHFEESHVFVPLDDALPDDALPMLPVVLSYPQPCALSPVLSPRRTPSPVFSAATSPTETASPGLPESSYVSSYVRSPSPSPSAPLALPPSSFIIPPSTGPIRTRYSKEERSGGRSYKASPRRSDPVRMSSGTTRKREKMFPCPKPGCTKSYLNPNGLKYHLEKGTCTVASAVESDA
ncbi:hypothetical protein BV25DRAFT_1194924 [Artomyces pyxidatus]|uniref:Uncharacterized protein n=1 Tax=Artomyces pyxidatus TaxID=48021 RepID=A0ACB8SQN4_9AGAM|nr:hypothetical protein BV25DRAFT_1194924 [Artomyces pyxidatus]